MNTKTIEIKKIHEPLASYLRPRALKDFVGQSHLLGEGRVLSQMIQSGKLHSMIFWGPPGVGKTSLAHLLANLISADLRVLSAVNSGVKEIRAISEEAEINQKYKNTQTILLIDEIHRFSKSQQDALLPILENGLVTLIGATTENPSFELNKALLSRCRVYVLKTLDQEELLKILNNALVYFSDYVNLVINFDLENKKKLIHLARQDARALLNLLEIILDLARPDESGIINIDLAELAPNLGESVLSFDKQGENFYDGISALHKSIRGSDPDASLYWMAYLLIAGVEGLYLARRLVRIASEDIGNADPRALQISLNAWDVYERLGAKEGELALAQAVIFLACAPKSNATYLAFNSAMAALKNSKASDLEVPLHLRNAPTELMKSLDYGKSYRYPHDEPNGYAAGENYFPKNISHQFYIPTDRGLEKQIQEKLKFLKSLR